MPHVDPSDSPPEIQAPLVLSVEIMTYDEWISTLPSLSLEVEDFGVGFENRCYCGTL